MVTPPAIIHVMSDLGGTLGERAIVTEYLRRNGIHVELDGECVSACMLFLTLPRDQVCAKPTAKFGHHSDIGEPDDRIVYESGKAAIARGAIAECRL